MVRRAATGSNLTMSSINTDFPSVSNSVNGMRSGSGMGWCPPSGTTSFGHTYGAFTLGPAAISTSTTVNTSNFGVISPNTVTSGGVNPGLGTYILYPGSNGVYTANVPSGTDNLRWYSRLLNHQVPWAAFFENTANSGLAIGMTNATWTGTITFTHGTWFSNGETTWFSLYGTFPSITSTSNYSGCAVTISNSMHFCSVTRANFEAGTYAVVEGNNMFGIGTLARNSQCNHYHRFGGTGITSLTVTYGKIGWRGYGYNHESTGIGPGSHYSPNEVAFKITNRPFATSHSGPGGGTAIG